MKSVYTTGDVAKLCQVSPGTVSRWFDRGMLKGFRVPGRSGAVDRRIPHENLVAFMQEHGLPMDKLEEVNQ